METLQHKGQLSEVVGLPYGKDYRHVGGLAEVEIDDVSRFVFALQLRSDDADLVFDPGSAPAVGQTQERFQFGQVTLAATEGLE